MILWRFIFYFVIQGSSNIYIVIWLIAKTNSQARCKFLHIIKIDCRHRLSLSLNRKYKGCILHAWGLEKDDEWATSDAWGPGPVTYGSRLGWWLFLIKHETFLSLLIDHLRNRLNFELDKNFITAWKSITKLVIFQSFRRCEML
jgi:hypothetical protein